LPCSLSPLSPKLSRERRIIISGVQQSPSL